MKTGIILLLAVNLFFILSCRKTVVEDYQSLIENGEFSKAKKNIEQQLLSNKNLSSTEKRDLQFEMERMERIRRDFTKTRADVLAFIKKYIPDVTEADMQRWEDEKSLEVMIIDGEKRYFNHAARNLFRINKACKKVWNAHHIKDASGPGFALDRHNRAVISAVRQTGKKYVEPVRMKISYSINVKKDAVPENETIRCWIPFPREIEGRQTDIQILRTFPAKYELAPKEALQRTIYFEQKAKADAPARFEVEYSYTNRGTYAHIDPEKVKRSASSASLADFLKEEPPHIVFSDTLKALSKKITGNEKNPYLIARKLFAWVDQNIPWASAREYSTIRNIPLYACLNRHGDCGIQTLLFITLCRLNGIPARWQSGWEFKPPDDSMHDWGMIWFEPYGWLPMDVTYGLRDTEDEDFSWFYLHGMDSYRLIFNDGISKDFVPPKEHFRSETVDSQRGEVEWRGGNLYFDQWDWNMEWREISGKQ